MKTDHRTALILLTVGLVSLFTYSSLHSPTRYDVREIGRDDLGQNVIVHGSVNDVNVKDVVTFIRLEKRPDLDIVTFRAVDGLEPGTNVTVHGTVDLYHGQLEILVDHIRTESDGDPSI